MKTRRRVLVLADQAASSLSNVVVTILVAGAVSSGSFGAFAAATVAYQLVTGGVRSVAGEPLLTLYSNEGPRARRHIVSDIQGTAVFLGLACSLVLVVLAQVLDSEAGSALLALALVLPFLVMQDTWRYLFVIDRPGAALGTDLVWLGAVLVALPLVPDDAEVSTYVLAWGLSGALGALVGTALGWGLPAWPHPWRWLATHRDMCWRYFVEFVTAQGAGQAGFAGLAVIAGATALGAARAAWVVYGFLVVVHSALYLILVPEGVRQRGGDVGRLRRKFVLASLIAMGISAGWMCVGLAAPSSLGERLFGDTWAQADTLLLPMGLTMIAGGALSGGLLGLRALGDAQRSLRARLLSTPLQLALPLVGAALDDARGFVLGLALSNAVSALIWWHYLLQATRELAADPDVELPPAPAELPAEISI